MRSHHDKGFTVVELMVAVLIIGILVALAVPVFNSASNAARSRACAANLRTLDGAVRQWAAVDESRSIGSLDSIALAKLAVGGYVKDYDSTVRCPGDGTVSVTDGDFVCSTVAHNYE